MATFNFQKSMQDVLQIAVAARTAEIAAYVSSETKNIVQSGPFAGMILPEDHSWGNGDLTPKLLGTYEQELHPVIEQAIERRPEVVFNVGCAEGYYAIGLARRLSHATVVAIDTDPQALRITQSSAVDNSCFSRVCTEEKFDLNALQYLVAPERGLVIMDVEGAELDLLTPDMIEALAHCDVIVECHDFITLGISMELIARLRYTHETAIVSEGPRDPNRISILKNVSSLDRWLAVSENRPCVMGWLVAWAK